MSLDPLTAAFCYGAFVGAGMATMLVLFVVGVLHPDGKGWIG